MCWSPGVKLFAKFIYFIKIRQVASQLCLMTVTIPFTTLHYKYKIELHRDVEQYRTLSYLTTLHSALKSHRAQLSALCLVKQRTNITYSKLFSSHTNHKGSAIMRYIVLKPTTRRRHYFQRNKHNVLNLFSSHTNHKGCATIRSPWYIVLNQPLDVATIRRHWK